MNQKPTPDITNKVKHPMHFWWMFMITGICLITFSIYVAINPAVTYDELSFFFAGTLLISGIFELAFCIANRKWFAGWGWYVAGGIFDLILVAILVINPILAGISLPFIAGFWMVIRSIVMIGRSLQVRKKGINDWPWLALWAASGLFLSLINMYNPVFGEGRPVIWTAFALLAAGVFYVHFGILIKSSDRWIDKHIHT
jgi:uncharacterized membrane protein HdeD (DUF308 family)